MTLPSFGIPSVEANVHALSQLAAANNEALRQVVMELANHLGYISTGNEQLLAAVTQPLRRSLQARARANNKQLSTVTNYLTDHLTGLAAANQSQLNLAQAGLRSPVPPKRRPPLRQAGGAPPGGPGPMSTDWYCIESNTTSAQSCAVLQNGHPPDGYTVVGGPYGTQLECQLSCGVPPPPPPPPPPEGNYWCVQGPNDACSSCWQGAVPLGYAIISGPYGTKDACNAVCGECAVPPPPGGPPPPPPPPPPTKLPGPGPVGGPPDVCQIPASVLAYQNSGVPVGAAFDIYYSPENCCYFINDTSLQLPHGWSESPSLGWFNYAYQEQIQNNMSAVGWTLGGPNGPECPSSIIPSNGGPPPSTTTPCTFAPGCPGTTCDNPLFIQVCTPAVSPTSQPMPGGQQPGPKPTAADTAALNETQPLCLATNLSDMDSIIAAFGGTSFSLLDFIPDFGQLPLIGGTVNDLKNQINTILTQIATVGGCSDPNYVTFWSVRGLLGILEHWVGVPFTEGHRVLDQYINYVCQTKLPAIGEAVDMYINNAISADTLHLWAKTDGFCASHADMMVQARRERLSAQEYIQWARRNNFGDDAIVTGLRDLGFVNVAEAAARSYIYDELPTIQDHLHFLQRNVFDDQYVADYGLMEGFTDRFWVKFGDDLRSLGMQEKYAALHYAAHWINPAPGQLLDMVYRLRPDKPGVSNPFTIDDYQRILIEQDVAPYFRKRFAETAYRVPALGYLRDMYRQYVISDDEMRSYHQDLGYTSADSERFVSIDRIVRIRQRVAQSHGWQPSAIAKAYQIGYIQKQDVYSLMDDLGFTQEESDALMSRSNSDLQYTIVSRARSRVLFQVLTTLKQSIVAGILDGPTAIQTLVGMGWPTEWASSWVGLQQTTGQVNLVKQVTQKIRQALLRGEITVVYAQSALLQLGMVPDVIDQTIAAWKIEMTPNRKRRSASQIESDLVTGRISEDEATIRLTNLGYEVTDRMLFIADSKRRILEREVMALASQAAQDPSAGFAIEKMLVDAGAQSSKLVTELRRIWPVKNMVKWISLGVLDEDTFFRRMQLLGYPDDDILRYWDEGIAGMKQPKLPKPPKPNKGGG